jgi:hypothetical protein
MMETQTFEEKKHFFFVTTVGEKCIWDTLEAIKKNTHVSYQLQIWYDARGKTDWDFYKRLFDYTDDVILVAKQNYLSHALGWMLLYNDADYIWFFGADCTPLAEYSQKVKKAFSLMPYVVFVGQPCMPIEGDIAVSNVDYFPDKVMVFNRHMINFTGGINASFKYYAYENAEFACRVVKNRYNFISLTGLIEEADGGHSGTDGWPEIKQRENDNLGVFMKCVNIMNANLPYNWWSNNVLETIAPAISEVK